MSSVPFSLESLGYKQDPNIKGRFVHPDGHPFYPVEYRENDKPNVGDCTRAIAHAAFVAGKSADRVDALRHCNTCGLTVDTRFKASKPIEGFPGRGPRTQSETDANAGAFAQGGTHLPGDGGLRPEKARCNRERSRAGEDVPRTCDICGIGPCARDNLQQ